MKSCDGELTWIPVKVTVDGGTDRQEQALLMREGVGYENRYVGTR